MTELATAGIPVTVTCRVLKLSRQPYYRWLANPITESEVVEAYRANALFDAVAWLRCEQLQLVPGGDHTVILGHVDDAATDGERSLGYHLRTFRDVGPSL